MLISYRLLLAKPLYVLINVIGVALGMAIALLILLYLDNQFSFDKHWQKDIYRLAIRYKSGNEYRRIAAAEPHIAPTLHRAFPQIKHITKILPTEGTIIDYLGNSNFYTDVFFADSLFFKVFDCQVLQGSVSNIFRKPESKEIILTQDLAQEIFGSENPIGKTLQLRTTNAFTYDGEYLVKAVIAKQETSHFPFKALISWNYEDKFVQNSWVYTYFTCSQKPSFIAQKWEWYYQGYLKRYFPNEDLFLKPIVQNVRDIYLNSKLEAEIYPNANKNYLFIFLATALLMIVVACINFVNLNAVRSTQRIREFAIRKVFGESRQELLIQLLVETLILMFLAFLVSLMLTELALPYFSQILQTPLALRSIFGSGFMLFWVITFLLMILLSGVYPVFYLVDIPILNGLKNILPKQNYRISFRKTLLVMQFTITIVILALTIMVIRQLNFVKNKDLGFDNQRVLVIRLPKSEEVFEKLDTLKKALMQSPDVFKIANSAEIIGTNLISQFRFEVENNGKLVEVVMGRMSVNKDFIDVMGLEIVQGRKFDERDTTANVALIINEAAATYMNWQNPIGKNFVISRDENGNPSVIGEVIGVVKNFHISSLHKKISPLVLVLSNKIGNLFLSVSPKHREEVLAYLQKTWQEILPTEPLNYFFLNENYRKHYLNEEKLAQILVYFSFLVAMVASLGLLGLSLFISELRLKEIAIRKVLGASRWHLVRLLSKDFIQLLLLSALIAVPLGEYVIHLWLSNFAYTTQTSANVFIGAFLLTFLIVVIPLFVQAFARVFINPNKFLQAG
ncbi:ABC transporter permease [Raineya orbicola]|uniref:ABC transporter permease n=1 Tax=Raineya orbicola TaxID=2016530 RepID=UPI001A9C7DCF|nr:ABC transporter permease [Raineya orbicola]